eukprot:2742398-Rhodomonas_salina.2
MPTPKLCEHNKVRSQCKQCGGTMRGICEHNRQRSQCKECGGGSICKHNRRRHDCKECGGASVCEHNRLRRRCKDCGGASICEHGRLRSQCKGCGGSSICEHNRQRSQCKDCRGSSFCEHSKLRCRCKQCGWLVQPAIKAITTRAQELESKGDWEGAIGAWDLFTNEAQKLLTRGQMKRRYCLEMQRTRQEAGGAQAAGDGKAVTLGTLAAMAGCCFRSSVLCETKFTKIPQQPCWLCSECDVVYLSWLKEALSCIEMQQRNLNRRASFQHERRASQRDAQRGGSKRGRPSHARLALAERGRPALCEHSNRPGHACRDFQPGCKLCPRARSRAAAGAGAGSADVSSRGGVQQWAEACVAARGGRSFAAVPVLADSDSHRATLHHKPQSNPRSAPFCAAFARPLRLISQSPLAAPHWAGGSAPREMLRTAGRSVRSVSTAHSIARAQADSSVGVGRE